MTDRRSRLLVVSPTFPYPLVSGGKQRVFYVLRELAREFDITLLTLAEPGDDTPEARQALDFLQEIVPVAIHQARFKQLLRLALRGVNWLLGTPAEVLVKRSATLQRSYAGLLGSGQFDAVLVEYSQLLDLVGPAQRAGLPVAVTAHDVSFVSQARKAAVSKGFWRWFWTREARLMRHHELRGWQKSDVIFAMSDTDREQILAGVPGVDVRTMPNGVDAERLQMMPEQEALTLVFVGWMRHFPNLDAVRWLLTEIWPILRARHAQVKLKICGGGMPDDLVELARADDRVEYLGFVERIDTEVGNSSLSVVPIRVGSGSRLKILESMALGTPVVSTTIGCEGILATDGQEVCLGDTPEAFASKVVELLQDSDQRTKLAGQARQLIEQRYDWKSIGLLGRDAIREMIAR